VRLRGKSNKAFLKQKSEKLLKGNTYVTTIHGISSCVVKLAKLMEACDIFRGSRRES
jgi:hypothetical protein